MEDEFLSVKEFADLINVHQNTVRRAIKSGKINCLRVGTGVRAIYRIPRTETNRLAYEHLEKVVKNLINRDKDSKNDSDLCP